MTGPDDTAWRQDVEQRTPVGADSPGGHGPAAAGAPPPADEASALFGRGLLYVAVLSLQFLAAIVVSPVLAHLLPPTEFGQLASAIALHQVLVVLAVLGIDQALVLFRAESGDDRSARLLIPIGLVLACVTTLIATATAPLWSRQLGFPGPSGIVSLTIAWTTPAAGTLLVSALLLSQDRLKAFTVVSLIAGVGGQVVGLTVLAAGGARSAEVYAVGNLSALVAALLLGLVLARPQWRGVVHGALARRALRLGGPLMVGSLAVFVLNAGDRLVIQRLLGAPEAGRYQIAYTVGNVAVLLLGMVSAAWGPQISAVRDDAARWALIGTARDRLLTLMTPIILGITLAAPVVLEVVAPASFKPRTLLLVVYLVALAGFPVLVGNASARELLVLERSRALAGSAMTAAVVNVGLNIVLVPHWGLAGAAAATLAAFVIQSVLHRLSLPSTVVWPRTPLPIMLAGAGAAVLSLATLALPQTPAWNGARFGLAVSCLPWLLYQLRRAQSPGAPALAGSPAVR
jgi:O-antigen/teichoic acid export membrane protein